MSLDIGEEMSLDCVVDGLGAILGRSCLTPSGDEDFCDSTGNGTGVDSLEPNLAGVSILRIFFGGSLFPCWLFERFMAGGVDCC